MEYPYLGDPAQADLQETFNDKLQAAADRLRSIALVAELERLGESGRNSVGTSVGSTFETLSALSSLQPDAQLRRTNVPIVVGHNESGRIRIEVKGHKIAVPAPVAENLIGLSAGSSIRASEVFPNVTPARSTRTAQHLARLGIFEVALAS